ncbi:hypothetical protein BI364_00125 [Acidihalobacter yilgarnensis]|uniref:Uncharacterized protein n=1 Tax=Acidihalobacter yilgarnensis TaxID=2819280 RepID=A0A1D8IJI2_9GAMM|nr:hypothetical protein BI364_00125 [Acidihalobacter yilgarnensis]
MPEEDEPLPFMLLAAQGCFIASGFFLSMCFAAQGFFIAPGLAFFMAWGAQGLHGVAAWAGNAPAARPINPPLASAMTTLRAFGFFFMISLPP